MRSRLSFAFVVVFSVAAFTGCVRQEGLNAEQQSVHQAMQEWSKAVSNQDAEAMWDMLSPDAQDVIRRELTADGGVRQTVKLNRAALAPEALTTDEDRVRLQKLLERLPEDPDKMTAKDYYVWRTTKELTKEGAERTVRQFDRSNLRDISVQGDKATVVLKIGEPDRYSWVRHDGDWKFDLHPSILRALEETRKREKQ